MSVAEFDEVALKPPALSKNAVNVNVPGDCIPGVEQPVFSLARPVRSMVQMLVPFKWTSTFPVAVAGNPDSDRVAAAFMGMVADVEPLTKIMKLGGGAACTALEEPISLRAANAKRNPIPTLRTRRQTPSVRLRPWGLTEGSDVPRLFAAGADGLHRPASSQS
jgi:hypothetical protein